MRQVAAKFNAGTLATAASALLERQRDTGIGLLRHLSGCFTDSRRADRVEHPLGEMLAQRIYGLALGYEDLKDCQRVAGKSTLSRMELVPDGDTLAERY